MSFIVSFNGQFQNYQLPDLSEFDRISRVYRSPKTKDVEGEDERTDLPGPEEVTPQKQKVQAYEEMDADFQKERATLFAKDLMTSPVHFLREKDSLQKLDSFFQKYHIRHVPLLDAEGTLVGIVSDRDLLQRRSNQSQIKEIMTDKVLTALHSTRVEDIAKIMLHEKIGAMPILNTHNEMIGIMTLTDILSAIVRRGGI